MRKILIANRGEIAVRIVRAARELGIATVQAHSDADADSQAVRWADDAVAIGPARASKSYLSPQAILRAAAVTGADAIHPGYGFLSENADFAEAVEAAGLIFIGPAPDTIRSMGDKARARAAANAAGVATVPGSEGRVDGPAAMAAAVAVGFPVMVKAAAGGGGRGIRVAADADALASMLGQAAAEATAAFGDGGLYVERFIREARHIEVQVLGDGRDVIHLHERECSLQRRRQKVWEESPAPTLPSAIREQLCDAAVRLARAVGYRGAGTLEFLYDEAAAKYYFIEMNTRIQVEHPVTEMVTGVDLVRAQIRIASGERLWLNRVEPRGHAIEVRINAEDAARDFMPAPGTVTRVDNSGGPGVRFDTALFAGCVVPPHYDSLLGKLIVWDEDRPAALARLRRALRETRIDGVPTTIAMHAALAEDPAVIAGAVHTRWLEPWLAKQGQP